MADEPTSDGPSMPVDEGPDAFFDAPSARGDDEFWSEAEAARSGAARTGTARRTGHRPTGLRQRVAAAWAAEASARRALRGRSAGTTSTTAHRRRLAAGIAGGLALLAVAVAVGESVVNDGPRSDRADAETATLETGSDERSPSSNGADGGRERSAVESEVVDAPVTKRTSATGSRPAATSSTTTEAETADPATKPKLPTPGGSGPAVPTPTTPAPATPVTTAPAPAPTAPPTTSAPRPPAAPSVQAFTAKAASSAGGACPPLQWATTFTWSTTGAATVTITGLLEPTLSNLPGGGSRVVCRLLPGGPLGGWTLTATGPGGTVTATA